jgi:hypothetical protein
MSESVVLPLAAALWDPDTTDGFRDQIGQRGSRDPASLHQRALRVRMQGTGYRALIDEQPVSLVNLSLSGVLVRGPMLVLPSQSIIFKIGWPQDERPCAAIGRVRWVRVGNASGHNEAVCEVGVAFETWDVRRLKEIMHDCRRNTGSVY